MKSDIFEAIKEDVTAEERTSLEQAWDALEGVSMEPDSPRMRRRFRWLLLREWGTTWIDLPRLAGLASMLVLGIFLGRLTLSPPVMQPDLAPYAGLLGEVSTAQRLEAMTVLRDASQALPAKAVLELGRILGNENASVGLRLAAAEALVAHRGQVEVDALLDQVRTFANHPPLIESRLSEAGAGGTSAAL